VVAQLSYTTHRWFTPTGACGTQLAVPRRKPSTEASRLRADVLRRLGAHLRRLRLERGISQEDVAELTGLSYKYIGRVELAKTNPGAIALVQFARAFKVSVGELFDTITPTSATGYRFSPADVETVNSAVTMLGGVIERVTSGASAPLPVRAPRRKRRK
jgi:DNA-binding XRE family transcriptional regulator